MGGHLDNNAKSKTRSEIENSSALGRKTHPDGLDLDLTTEEITVAAIAAGVDTATTSSILTNNGNVPRYHIPYPFAFNGGKPFSLEKDPITGKIDFEKAPSVRVFNYTSDYHEHKDQESEDERDEENAKAEEKADGKDNNDVGPNEINTYIPNFHDFLNLPIHYSSDKYGNDKYPLISNSYANTKIQSGTNSYNTYNHRPHHPGNDLYVYPTKNSYVPMTKNTYKIATITDFIKAKCTSATMTTTPAPSTTTDSSRFTFTTSTKAPIITTWKPSNTPFVFHSIDRTGIDIENEKNLLPIEKLHASGHAASQENPNTSNVPVPMNNDMVKKIQASTHYKNQSSLNNFVLSDVTSETKPLQSEEYRDSYDTYESSDNEEEGESEVESANDDNSKENDYFLPFRELLKKDVILSTPPTMNPVTSTTSTTSMTTPTITTMTTTMTLASSAAGTIMPAIPSSGFASSALSTLQSDAFASDPQQYPMIQQQHPVTPSSLMSDRRQSIATAERYDDAISHGYKLDSMIKSEPDRTGIMVESTSNIVIPPDQDTVSFVLGNRQNVDGSYYSIGTAVGENPYSTSSDIDMSLWSFGDDSHGLMKEIKHERLPISSITELSSDRIPQKWWSPNSGGLKNGNSELDPIKFQNTFIAATNPNIKNQNIKNKDYVVFPDDETKNKDTVTKEHIVIINEADDNIHELSPKTVLTTTTMTTTTIATNKTINFSANGDLPQLAEDLMPPAENSRLPSYHYHAHHHQFDTVRPNHSRPQRLPLPPPPSRVKLHSVPPVPVLDVGLRKHPYSPDTKLPNILPQFRPNAKASYGHRGSDMIGTMPAGQGSPVRIRQPPLQSHLSSRRPPPPPPPSYLQRLNPPPPPIHAVRLAFVPISKTDSVTLPYESEPTIQRFRSPHVSPISRGNPDESTSSNRLLRHGTSQEENKSNHEVIDEKKEDRDNIEIANDRETEASERYPEEPPIMPPKSPLFPKRRTADRSRVTTLQMIQHHGEPAAENEAESVESVLTHEAERRKSDDHDPSEVRNEQPPVYVVYPVNTAVNIHPDDSNERDGSVVVGTRGPHRPLPPDTLLQDGEENTHTVYNGRPIAPDFPYPLEHSDPSSIFSAAGVKETPLLVPSEQRQQASYITANDRDNEKNEQDAEINVIPYLQDFLPYRKKNDATISVTLHRASPTSTVSIPATSMPTSTPIAYIYTPTHTAHLAHRFDNDKINGDNNNNDANGSVDRTTVLLPSQQPSSSSSSAPAPQNFMAPFVASLSAEAPSKNGWSVVVMEPSIDMEKKLNNDNDDAKFAHSEVDVQTEKSEFDADNFKPQLFGGFKPIYEFPIEDMERDSVNVNSEMNTSMHSKILMSVPDEG